MDDFFTRHEGESDQECIYRICAMKDELGYTWPEMAEVLNDALQKSYSDSKYRKDYTAFCKYSNYEPTQPATLSNDALEVAKERQKLYATKIETSRILRQKSRQELFYENVAYAIKTLPVPEFESVDVNNNSRSYEYVLTIADLQAGAKFDLDCNSYSLDECAKRFWMLYSYVVDYVVTHDQIEAMTMADRIVVMKDGYIQQVGNPYELYFHPVNQFVAGFIGEPPMNFVRANVIDGCVEIAGGKHDLSMVIGDEIKAYEGKEIIVGFRPEAISLAEVENSFKLSASVELTELLGDNTNVYVDMNGEKAILKVDPHDTPEMDISIDFHLPHKSVYLFDAVTEEVINKYE